VEKVVDARGQACPQRVILARRAMKEPGSDTIVVLVDNDTARQNVTRMAEREGYLVTAEPSGEDVRLTLTPSPAGSQALDAREKAASAPIPPTGEAARPAGLLVLLIASEGVGQGDSAELGGILMRSFLHTLVEAQPLPDVALFLNSGVRLVADGSPAVEDLRALEQRGMRIAACGTCLEYYGLKDRLVVGEVTNMYSVSETLLGAARIVRI